MQPCEGLQKCENSNSLIIHLSRSLKEPATKIVLQICKQLIFNSQYATLELDSQFVDIIVIFNGVALLYQWHGICVYASIVSIIAQEEENLNVGNYQQGMESRYCRHLH